LNRGRTDKQLHHVNRGRTENYKVKDWNKKEEIIKYLTQRKIPRGRSKTEHQLKISTSTNLQEQSKTSILQTKITSTNFNGQISSSISKERCQLVPKNFASLLTDYYMKMHQNSTFNKTWKFLLIKRPLLKFIMNKFCNFNTSIQWATSNEPILFCNSHINNKHGDISNFINSNHL
jgi:hypothetical protein